MKYLLSTNFLENALGGVNANPRTVGGRRRVKGRMKQTLGGVLKAARVRCELTQEQLASRVGATESYLAYLETDQRQPSLELLSCLAQALGWSPISCFCWRILKPAHYSGDKHGRGVGPIRLGAHSPRRKACSPGTMCSRTN